MALLNLSSELSSFIDLSRLFHSFEAKFVEVQYLNPSFYLEKLYIILRPGNKLNLKMARCSARPLESNFHPSLSRDSVADVRARG